MFEIIISFLVSVTAYMRMIRKTLRSVGLYSWKYITLFFVLDQNNQYCKNIMFKAKISYLLLERVLKNF